MYRLKYSLAFGESELLGEAIVCSYSSLHAFEVPSIDVSAELRIFKEDNEADTKHDTKFQLVSCASVTAAKSSQIG